MNNQHIEMVFYNDQLLLKSPIVIDTILAVQRNVYYTGARPSLTVENLVTSAWYG